MVRRKKIDAPVEIADPETPPIVYLECGNVTAGQTGRRNGNHFLSTRQLLNS
jgi:hypothetical protein